MPEWNEAQRDLAALIERIFADGRVDESERQELRQFWAQRQLSVKLVREVVETFASTTWREVMADGVVTAEERQRLWVVVDALHLPEASMPSAMWQAITARS